MTAMTAVNGNLNGNLNGNHLKKAQLSNARYGTVGYRSSKIPVRYETDVDK
jgi:hypothetical protein